MGFIKIGEITENHGFRAQIYRFTRQTMVGILDLDSTFNTVHLKWVTYTLGLQASSVQHDFQTEDGDGECGVVYDSSSLTSPACSNLYDDGGFLPLKYIRYSSGRFLVRLMCLHTCCRSEVWLRLERVLHSLLS